MTEARGSIWDYHANGYWVVIPTNLQFSRGRAHMGKGLAKDAADRFPGLAERYGAELDEGNPFATFADLRLICLPTKDHWRDPAYPAFVVQFIGELSRWATANPDAKLVLPHVGCGLGGLRWEEVRPFVERLLPTDRTVVVAP